MQCEWGKHGWADTQVESNNSGNAWGAGGEGGFGGPGPRSLCFSLIFGNIMFISWSFVVDFLVIFMEVWKERGVWRPRAQELMF